MINSVAQASFGVLQRGNLFSKIDANSDKAITKEEFVAAKPKQVSQTKASELFDKLDTNKTGSIDEAQFNEGMEKNRLEKTQSSENLLSSSVLGALLQIAQQSDLGQSTQKDDMFAQMDIDGNGAVSKEEFIAARPDDVSEEQASNLFAKLDKSNTGSITQTQLEDGMSAKGKGGPPPAGGPPPSGGAKNGSSSEEDSSQSYDKLDTNKDGKISASELLAGLEEEAENSTDSTQKAILNAFADALKNYSNSNNLNLDEAILLNKAA